VITAPEKRHLLEGLRDLLPVIACNRNFNQRALSLRTTDERAGDVHSEGDAQDRGVVILRREGYAGVAREVARRSRENGPTRYTRSDRSKKDLGGRRPARRVMLEMVWREKISSKLDQAAKRLAEIVMEQLFSLPLEEAKTIREEIHRMAAKPSRRGRTSRPRRNGGPRPLLRTSAKSS
jgi:hypothetical protein